MYITALLGAVGALAAVYFVMYLIASRQQAKDEAKENRKTAEILKNQRDNDVDDFDAAVKLLNKKRK